MEQFFPNSMQNLPVNALGDSVDIIMRTKNRPILLVRALASVLSQNHQNWHLFLINDGGNKKKLENTLESYLPAFGEKLTLINNENSLGMEAASNEALQLSKGDFIVVHDDDDSWHPAFLAKCVEYLRRPENRNYAGVITNCELIRETIEDCIVKEVSREQWFFFKAIVTYKDLLIGNFTPPITFLIRKDAADVAGKFNPNLPVLGDWDYIIRIMQVGDIATINENLAYYHHRINVPNSVSEYQNTVTNGVDRHNLYNALYTNASMRATLNQDPALIGLFRYIAASQKEILDGDRESYVNVIQSKIVNGFHQLECNQENLRLRLENIQVQIDYNYKKMRKAIKYCGTFGKICLELKRWRKKYFKR